MVAITMKEKDNISEHIVIVQKQEDLKDFGKKQLTIRERYRAYLAELLATFIFVAIGTGAVTQMVLHSESGLVSSIGHGIALTVAVMMSGPISGSHVNPAITLSLACCRGFPYRRVPGYFLVQLLGSLLGSTLIYLANISKLAQLNCNQIVSIFTSSPSSPIVLTFFLQATVTAFLLIGIQAAANPRLVPEWLFSIAVGVLLIGLGLAFPGVAVNPATDFMGRVLTTILGYSDIAFFKYPGYFVVPLVAPCLGAIAGIILYDLMVINLDLSTSKNDS